MRPGASPPARPGRLFLDNAVAGTNGRAGAGTRRTISINGSVCASASDAPTIEIGAASTDAVASPRNENIFRREIMSASSVALLREGADDIRDRGCRYPEASLG